MAGPAAHLNILVTAQTGPASRDLSRLDAQLTRTSKSANQTLLSMKSLARGAALGGVAVAAHQAVDAFVGFDKSMRNVNSIARLNEKRFDALSKQVLKLAGPTAQAPKTLADGLYQLVSSGFDANQSIKILRKSAVAATAGLTDTATATQVVAAAINSYGLAAKDAGHVSDVLFRTVDRGVLTFADLAQSLGPVLPAANSLNVSLEQVGAALATLTKQGFPAAEAATAIDSAMRALLKPSDAMKAAFKELGVSGGEELVRKYGNLQAALQALKGTTDGSGAAMNKLFNQIRGARGALGLTGQNARGAAKDLKAMGEASGATSRAFKEQAKSAAVQWARLKAQLAAYSAEAGTVLFPILLRTIRILKSFADVATTLRQGPLARLIEVFIAIGNPITRFIGLIRILISVVKTLSHWFGSLADAARPVIHTVGDGLTSAFRGLSRAANIALTPLRKAYGLLKGIAGIAGGVVGKIGSIGKSLNPFGAGQPLDDFFGQFAPFAPFTGSLGSKSAKGVDSFNSVASKFGLQMTSGFRPGDPGWHGQNRARDYSNGYATAQELTFAKFMANTYGGKLLELIHTPLGFGIKNGKKVPLSFWGASVNADHFDHVHVALQRGGGVPGFGSGDKIPAMLEPGEFVMNRNAVASAGPLLQAINDGVPRMASGGTVAKAAYKAGFRGNNLVRALAEAWGESGWNEGAIGDGGNSIGLMQIYQPAHPWARALNLKNPFVNMRAAMRVFRESGGSWAPWHADHRPGIGRARAAVSAFLSSLNKKAPKKPAPKKNAPGRSSPGASSNRMSGPDIRNAFLGAFDDQIAFRNAMAALTGPGSVAGGPSGLMDDILVAQDATRGYQGWLDFMLRRKDQAGATQAATSLKQWQDALADLLGTGPGGTTDDNGRAALLEQMLREANQRTAVSQAQYGVFAGMSPGRGYASGGVVSAQPIVNVNMSGNASLLERFIDHRIEHKTRSMARGAPLPGRGGGNLR